MYVHQQRLTVPFEYPVYFVVDALEPTERALVDAIVRREPSRRHRAAFLIEERVAELWPDLPARIARYCVAHALRLEAIGEPLVVPGGEDAKNDPGAPERLVRAFDAWHLDRQSVVVVVGGGALQDLAGYAAAITHRGLRVVRMPTTVLSQNDGGVGVKNGVNAYGKKNLVGTFAPPFAVIDAFQFLETLDPRDTRAGMAEAVKVALLKDADFFRWMVEHAAPLARFEPAPLRELIRRCALLHLAHIAQGGDPFELGSSRPLDYGHWVAHKLESLTDFRLRHGEAVGIGLALDSRYSVEVGLLDATSAEGVAVLLEELGLCTWDDAMDARDEQGKRRIFVGLDEFREHLGGDLTLTMLEGIASPKDVHDVDMAAMERSIAWLKARQRLAERRPVSRAPAGVRA